MSTQKDRLAQLRRIQNPLGEVLSHIQYIKGDKGKSPTDEELLALIRPLLPTDADLLTLIKPLIPEKAADGHTPSKEELVSLIRPLIPQVQDGETPTKEQLIALIKPLIPKPVHGKPGISPPIEDILTEFRKRPINYAEIANAPDLTDLPKLIEFLKRGGFRGGEGSSTSAGGGFTQLAATETPNGVLTVFTFASATTQPSFVLSDNVWYKATTKAGTVNWTWNAGAKQATLTIPPTDDIGAVV